ncbi:MAG: VCBS repeat-containing protein [Polyangiaceae bacterium]
MRAWIRVATPCFVAAMSVAGCRGGDSRLPSSWADPAWSSPRCAYGGIRPTTFVGPAANALALADVDLDGRLDAIVARPEAHAVVVARGRGDGTFAAPVPIRVEGTPVAMSVGDLDGDGRADVAVLELGLPRVTVLAASADGPRLIASAPLVGPPPSVIPVIAVGDLDGDGAADVVVTDGAARAVVVLRGTRDGGRAGLAPPRVVDVSAEVPRALALGDFDGNRTVDMALAGSDGVSFLAGDGRGGFVRVPRGGLRAPAPPDAPSALAVFAVPKLGRDVLAVRSDEGAHTVLGLGAAPVSVGGPADGRASNRALVVADLDRDGAVDLVDISTEVGAVSVRRTNAAALSGAPIARPAPKRPLDLDESDEIEALRAHELVPSGRKPIAVSVGDLDGDGAPDLVSLDREGFVGATMNHGDGTFGAVATFPAPTFVNAMAIADVDADGDGDVVVLSTGTRPNERVTSFLRRGAGVVAVSTPLRLYNYALGVFDADLDGRLDAVTLHSTDRKPNETALVVHRGSGDGRFDAEGVAFPLPLPSHQMTFADVDGDRATDVILGADTGEVFVLRNVRNGFAPPLLLGKVSSDVRALAVDDFDRDGRLDVAASCRAPTNEAGVAFFGALLPGTPPCVPLNRALAAGPLAGSRLRFAPLGANELPRWGRPFALDDLDGDGRGDLLYGDGPNFVVMPGRDDGTFASPLRHWLRVRDNVTSHPFDMTITADDEVKGLAVLRGQRGQAPALAVVTLSGLAVLPRVCWRSP